MSVVTKSPRVLRVGGVECASPKNEPNLMVQLFGRNEVPFVELWGWASNIPLTFPTLRADLNMQTYVYTTESESKMPKELVEARSLSEFIDHLPKSAPDNGFVACPLSLVVQIVAKKKTDVIFLKPKDTNKQIKQDKPSQVLVMGHLVVADETGLCPLVLINESVERIHAKVEVGDFLILYKAYMKKINLNEYLKVIFPFHNNLVGVELKVEKYSTRRVHHVPFRSQQVWKPTLPDDLFPESCKMWTPSALQHALERREKMSVAFLDLIGVVVYVGRVERCQMGAQDDLTVRDPNAPPNSNGSILPPTVVENHPLFQAYRWIQIIDQTSQPFSIKLMITGDNLDVQCDIVPGALIVITQCNVFPDNVNFSYFSQIYLNEDTEKYFQLMPRRYILEALGSVASFESYNAILKRKDVKWGVGGTLYLPLDIPFFKTTYQEWKSQDEAQRKSRNRVPDNFGLASRREHVQVTFRGRILLVMKVTEENCLIHLNPCVDNPKKRLLINTFEYGDQDEVYAIRDNERESNPNVKWFRQCSPCLCEKCHFKTWFQFRRAVTLPVSTGFTKTRALAADVTEKLTDLCAPLLLPAIYSSSMLEDDIPELAKLPRLEKFDHYRLTIRDEDTGDWYEAMWKTHSMEEMKTRYTAALDKIVLGEIHIFQSDANTFREVVLRDFILEEELEETESEHCSDTSNELFMDCN